MRESMKNRRGGQWQFGAANLAILVLLYACVATGAEVPSGGPSPQAEEDEARPKPPEKPPEPPGFPPSSSQATPFEPFTSLEAVPTTGILAPYGNPLATDPLAKGWQTHRLGALRVSPYLGYDAIYRTNLFGSPNNKKADFANSISPGIRFELPVAGKDRLSFGYFGSAFLYSRFNNQSHYDQNFNAAADFNFNRLDMSFGSALRMATEEANAKTLRQRPYDRVSPYFSAGYRLADVWKIEGNYQFDSFLFAKKQDNIDEYQNNLMGLTLFYKLLPKTSAFLQYNVDLRNHPFNHVNDNVTQSPFLGLQWDPTAKITGSVKFGYTVATYNNHNVPGRDNAPAGFAFSIQTSYKYSRSTSITLIAQRSVQEDVDFNNNGYVNTGFTLTLTHLFDYFKVTSYASFAYYNNRYVGTTLDAASGSLVHELNNITSAGAGLSRPVTKWLRVRLDYLYNNTGSNISNLSYNEHFVSLGLQSSF